MAFTIGLAQCVHPVGASWHDAVTMAERWARRAQQDGVDLLVFPESLMTRYEVDRHAFFDAAQPIDGPYCQVMNGIAREFRLWIVYSVNEANPLGHPFNTVILADDKGVCRASYRKTHLFDTDFTRESDRMAAGGAIPSAVDTPFGRIGLSICYDLRFPEVARHLALQDARLLIVPAAWVDGRLKAEQWRTLLAARAIENEVFVAGVSRVDSSYIGQSALFGPDGTLRAAGGVTEDLVCTRIDLTEVDRVRAAMPVLSHRRPELYGSLSHDK